MARNQGFENSLRCLRHPISLLSIALLLLNDHVFKVFSPSWLTGKLSDFAGLFFFPFIVAAGLSVLSARLNLKSDGIGKVSYGLVAVWFISFKTIPSVNQASVFIISSLLGHPVQLLLDPFDTLALVVLYPSWKLWRQVGVRNNGKPGYAPLILGAIACMATSPVAPEVEVVTHLISKDESLFAFDSTNGMMAVSEDGGRTWDWANERDFSEFPREMKAQPVIACLPYQQQECYRINGQKVVEESNDGGKSWNISWQFPADRISYMQRTNPEINLGPYDLLIVPWENRNYVLVAAGEDGILRRELPDGEWERIQVRNAYPTSYRATNLSDAFSSVWGELAIWFILSIITFLVACQVVWSSNSKGSMQPPSRMQWVYLPALSTILGILATLIIEASIGIIFYGMFLLAQYSGYNNYLQPVLLIALITCLVTALLTLPATIYRVLNKWSSLLINHNYPPQTASKLVWRSYLTHISVFVVGTVNWILWAMGIISRYEITWISALLSTGFIAAIFIRNIADLAKRPVPLQDAN